MLYLQEDSMFTDLMTTTNIVELSNVYQIHLVLIHFKLLHRTYLRTGDVCVCYLRAGEVCVCCMFYGFCINTPVNGTFCRV